MMNKVLEEVIPWIELLENVAYDDSECPNAFERQFCDDNELLGIWFSSENILVSFLTSSGVTVQSTYSIREFNQWLGEGDDDYEEDDD